MAYKSAQVERDQEPGVHMNHRGTSSNPVDEFNNDPSAGSPTETLLRLLLPLNDQV